MEHIVFLDRSTVRATLPGLSFPHQWQEFDLTRPDQILSRCRDATIIITNKVPLTADTLRQLPKLRLVAIPATGMDHVDRAWCKDNAVAVMNCPDYSVHSVPEHAISMMMTLRRNLLTYRRDLLNGEWERSESFCLFSHPVRDLYGSTLSIFGKGSLGRETARLAKAFGMRVLYADHRHATTTRAGYVRFEEALGTADVVSLHCPLNELTRNLIGRDELKLMKRDAVLINTARGGLVDESALLEALTQGQIAGAALDVLSEEPPKPGHPLLDLDWPNLLITPHVAWISDSAMAILSRKLMDGIEDFVAHRAS